MADIFNLPSLIGGPILGALLYSLARHTRLRSRIREDYSIFRISAVAVTFLLLFCVALFILGILCAFSTDDLQYPLDIILGFLVILCFSFPCFIFYIHACKKEIVVDDEKIVLKSWRSETKTIQLDDIDKIEIYEGTFLGKKGADGININYRDEKVFITCWLSGYEDFLDILLSRAEGAEIIKNKWGEEISTIRPATRKRQSLGDDNSKIEKCINCGYQRQPKDDRLISSLECPKCGIIYKKAKMSK